MDEGLADTLKKPGAAVPDRKSYTQDQLKKLAAEEDKKKYGDRGPWTGGDKGRVGESRAAAVLRAVDG